MKYVAYNEYQPSGADWLGEVPAHWTVKAIKWESPVLRGASPRPIDDPIYFDDDGEYAWVRISDVTEAGTYLENTEQKLSDAGARLSVKLKPGDLFLSIAGSVGKPCITRIKCCIHDGFVYFPRWKADPKFLYYLFASGEPYKGLGKMGTQLNLNTDTVGSIVIGLPEAEEQQTIARFLDAKTAQIDALVAHKRQLIAKLKEKRSALIARTVTRGLPPEAAKAAGLEPNPEMKDSGVEWLGQLPMPWQVLPMTKYLSDMSDYRGKTPEKTDNGVFLVTARNVRMGYIDYESSQEFVAVEEYDEIMRRGLPKLGDILFTTEAPLGNVALVDREEIALAQRIIRFRMRRDFFHSRFTLYAMLADYFQSQLKSLSTGSTAEGLKASKLSVLRLIAPPVAEQQVIASFLDAECGHMDGLLATTETAIERLQEYRQSLITSAVTGKIDVRGLA